jgi:hypothetical protein
MLFAFKKAPPCPFRECPGLRGKWITVASVAASRTAMLYPHNCGSMSCLVNDYIDLVAAKAQQRFGVVSV